MEKHIDSQIEMKTERPFTSYCNKQTRLNYRNINIIYCEVKRIGQ